MSEALAAVRAALRDERAWLVGGAVRDRLLGRPVGDVDLVIDGDAKAAARHLALEVGGPSFELSDAFGAWRVIGPGRGWQADVMPLREPSIGDDLAQRDFTVNAIAEPLGGGELLDPFSGVQDLEEGRLRMVSAEAFDRDPLRTLRLARFACELGLEPDPATVEAATARAGRVGEVASERVFAELKRIVVADAALEGLALMDRLGLTAQVLPELEGLRGVTQNAYHHLDVHGHTLEVLARTIALERDPAGVLGDAELGGRAAAVLAEPLADELTRGGALRFGALLHDAAKPATRVDLGEGRVGFPGHDSAGADLSRAVLERLRASEKLRAHVAGLARHHLRLGFLVHQAPLSRKALYDYLAACGPVAVDVTLLSVADRLATRGRKADESIARHMDLAREVLTVALDARDAGVAAPLVRGDELAAALDIEPGPRLGQLLEAIAEARFTGEVSTPDEAVALARRLLRLR
jgi:tRNA nucleotidyltransferase/poly(A) polymerase